MNFEQSTRPREAELGKQESMGIRERRPDWELARERVRTQHAGAHLEHYKSMSGGARWAVRAADGTVLAEYADTSEAAWIDADRSLAAVDVAKPEPSDLLEGARDVEQLTLLICSPWQWLDDPERKRVADALLRLREVLSLYSSQGQQGKAVEK